jgi:glutathione S-transferase
MNDLILHHYPASPFAEKIRLLLGHKGLAWRSVTIPVIMPKPDLTALTGGYRRTPVLQIGADVYCDTALIARVIDRLHPTPPLYSDLTAISDLALAHFADQHLFAAAVAYAMQPAGMRGLLGELTPEQIQAFAEDRKAMRQGGTTQRLPLAEGWTMLLALLPRLDAQLADGRHWLNGASPHVADFCVYHPLWFVQRAGLLDALVAPYPHLRGWFGRMAAIGHGEPQPMSSGEAVEVARASRPAMLPGRSLREVDGCAVGDRVSVAPTDYGVDPVTGVLANADADAIAVRRTDERAGEVVVHFPRLGYRMTRVDG